jgi:hypothetical protein
VPPQKIQKTAAKWLISLKTGVKRRRELSNSGGPVAQRMRFGYREVGSDIV